MDTDWVAISALIIGVLGALGHLIETSHLKKIKIGCIQSDCTKSPAPTPVNSSSHLCPSHTATGC